MKGVGVVFDNIVGLCLVRSRRGVLSCHKVTGRSVACMFM